MSSSKWSPGGWGIAGGQYGEIVCTTCHTAHSTKNIFLIKETITASSGAFPGSIVDFRNLAGTPGGTTGAYSMGDDTACVHPSFTTQAACTTGGGTWDGAGNRCTFPSLLTQADCQAGGHTWSPRTTSTRVCEVCHSRTRYHNFNANNNVINSGNFSHNNAGNCTSCHTHKIAFSAAGGACDSCHGNPPVANTLGGPSGLSSSPATKSTDAGKHQKHATVGTGNLNYSCETCHTGYIMPDTGRIDIGFSIFGVAGGSYIGQTGVTYVGRNGTTVTATGARSCSNIYCHSAAQSPTGGALAAAQYKAPVWLTTAAALTCASCHEDMATSATAPGSHRIHANTTTGYGMACANCHNGAMPPASTVHVNNVINVAFNATFGGTYGGNTANTGNHAPGQGYGSCTATYCHSQGTTAAAPFTPNIAATWGGTLDATCTGCHSGNSAATNRMATNAHGPHVTDPTGTPQVGKNIGCQECHNATASADRTLSVMANHIDKLVNVKFDNVINRNTDLPTYNGTATTGAAGSTKASGSVVGSCSNVYCHSVGNLDATGAVVAAGGASFRPIPWNAAPIDCSGCHGDSATVPPKSHPVYASGAAGSTTANSHVKHVESSSYSCDFCHNTTTTNTAIPPTSVVAGGPHLNRVENVSFKLNGGLTGTYNATAKTCSATLCHGPGPSIAWGTTVATTAVCTTCHDASSTGLSTRHDRHFNSATAPTALAGATDTHTATGYVYACLRCHPTATHSQGPADSTPPVLQDAQVLTGVLPAKIQTYTQGGTSATDARGFNYTQGTCTSVCHTRDGAAGAPVVGVNWGTAPVTGTTCGICHNKAGDATPTWTAPHTVHVNTYSVNTNITCNSCHAGTATDNATINGIAGRNQHPDAVKNVAFNAFSNTTATYPNATTGCSNTYCHSNGTTATGTHAAILWSGTMNAECSSCHGGDSAAVTKVATVAHGPHVTDTANQVGKNMGCAECHAATVSANRVISNRADHVNKLVNVKFDNVLNLNTDAPTFNAAATTGVDGATKAAGAAAGSCSNVYCHSIGNLAASGGAVVAAGTPAVGFRTIAWNAGAINCSGCHGDSATVPPKSHPVYATGVAGSTTANSHISHVESSSYGCDFCHNTTTTNTTIPPTTVLAGGPHLNRVENVSFKSVGGLTGAYSATAKTCSATFCHGTAASPAWGSGTTAVNCGTCHASANTGLSTRHDRHYNTATLPTTMTAADAHTATTYVYGCNNCHPTATHSQGPVSALQAAQVAGTKISAYTAGTTSAADPRGFNYTTTGTCTSVCHTRDGAAGAAVVAVNWGTAPVTGTTCGICHNKAGDATPVWTAPHTKHINTYAANTNMTCNACHSGTATDNATINGATGRAQHLNTVRNVALNTFSGGTWSGTQCSNTYCHSAGTAATGTHAAISWSGLTTCASCHASPVATGSHTQHVVTGGYTCDICHSGYTSTAVTAATHVNKLINTGFAGAAAGTTYSKGTSFAPGTAGGTCSTSVCHGSVSPAWGTTVAGTSCQTCHGDATNNTSTSPFRSTSGATLNTDTKAGAHTAHLGSSNAPLGTPTGHAIATNVACNECHTVPATSAAAGHTDTALPAEVTFGTLARTGGLVPAYNATTGQCSNIYCHGSTLSAAATANRTPTWNVTLLTGVATNDCGRCHGYPPATATHTGVTPAQCGSCHSHINATGTGFINVVLHINGTVEGGDCVSCHNTAQAITVGPLAGTASRRAVSLEFASTWSHKRSAAGAVTKYDCIVCHMEGEMTGGNPTALHKNGLIELRDPDTGLTIKGVTFGGTGAGAYTATATDATPARFSRNLASNVIEPDVAAIQINHCLKCHDGNGALSTTARVPGGTAEKPFATTIAGAGYTGAGITANGVLGGVTDIAAAFNPANSTYHPVMGKQNNWYAKLTRLAAPWNVTTRGATVNNTSYGDLISCWDCHAASGATGVLTSTVTAHGGAATLRGAVYETTNALCKLCHAGYTGTTSHHGTGSAFASNTNSGMTTFLTNQCQRCHASTNTAVRPIRGEDAHGFNRFAGTGTDALWPRGATETYRPYAFMRNTTQWVSTSWKPLSGPGVPTGSATCGGTMSASGCADNMSTYTPGGVY